MGWLVLETFFEGFGKIMETVDHKARGGNAVLKRIERRSLRLLSRGLIDGRATIQRRKDQLSKTRKRIER